MLCALCMSYHSNTEVVLFTCLSSGWITTTGSLLGPKMKNSIKCLSHEQSDALPHREFNQGFATFSEIDLGLLRQNGSRVQKTKTRKLFNVTL